MISIHPRLYCRADLRILKHVNWHPRDDRVYFDEGPHKYYIDGDRRGYISVTTYIDAYLFHNPFDKHAALNASLLKDKYRGMSRKQISQYWKRTNLQSQLDGTKMHANIEYYNNGFPYYNHDKEWFLYECFEADFPYLVALRFRTEWVIYDDELCIPGSIDMVYRDPNNPKHLILYDWKRCKVINTDPSKAYGKRGTVPGISDHLPDLNFWHYAFQLNIYRAIIEKNYGYHVSEMYILCLHPSQETTYLRYKIERMDREIERIFELRRQEVEGWKLCPETSPYNQRVFEPGETFIRETCKWRQKCAGCSSKMALDQEVYRNEACDHNICEECYLERYQKHGFKVICEDCVLENQSPR